MEAATAINKNFGHVHKLQLDLRMVEIWSNFIKQKPKVLRITKPNKYFGALEQEGKVP